LNVLGAYGLGASEH